MKKQPAQSLPLYELKITLRGSKPAVWRRVLVPGGINLNRLHDVLQIVMGWTDSHLHHFVDAPTRVLVRKRVVEAVAQHAVVELSVAHPMAPPSARNEVGREIHVLHAAGDRAQEDLLRRGDDGGR